MRTLLLSDVIKKSYNELKNAFHGTVVKFTMFDLKLTEAFNSKINKNGFINIQELQHVLLLTY